VQPVSAEAAQPRAARPFVKWAGGKARLVPVLLAHLPPHADELRHVEPFVGGGALFFARRPARALLADSNRRLMDAYQAIQQAVDGVIGGLEVLATGHSVMRFEEVRELFNSAELPRETRAAMLIYLNKTCFNGIYRVNRKGAFNVPPGVFSKPPRVLDRENLLLVHEALRSAELRASDFTVTLERCGKGDFVYIDPPYIPTSKTSNFTSYTEDGFDDNVQYQLAREVVKADKRGAKILVSQSETELARRLYQHFHVHSVNNTRSLSSDTTTRGQVAELLISNY